jgi:phenol hydroxylase P1 protein
MSEWAKVWSDRVQAALAPVAEIALADQGQDALQATREALNARATKAGLTL